MIILYICLAIPFLILLDCVYCGMSDMLRMWKFKRGIVIQNRNAMLHGMYKGCIVSLRPVIDENNPKRVERWEPAPSVVNFIETKIAEGQVAAQTKLCARDEYLAVPLLEDLFVKVRSGSFLSKWNYNDFQFSRYKGKPVWLRPVVSMDNQREIVLWVQDPVGVRAVEFMLAKEQGADGTVGASAPSSDLEQPQQKVGRIIIDGSNVVFADNSNLVVGLKTCLIALGAHKTSYFVFFDANIFHKLAESENGVVQVAMLKELIDKSNGAITLVPAGARADDFILKKADTEDCHVLSNDRYKPYVERYPWIEQGRVHRFSFVDGRLMIPDLDVDVLNC